MKKKVIIISVCSFFGLILIIFASFYAVFFNEVNAVLSVKKIDDNIYYMNYNNNYFFDDFLKTGASSDEELVSFITKKVLHGLPINISLPDYGCSSFTSKTEEGEECLSRNLDIDYNPIMIVKTNPNKGYKSLSVVNLGVLGLSYSSLPNSVSNKALCLAAPYVPHDGINEMGVSICVNMLNGEKICQDTEKTNITTTTLIRLVLDKAKNTDEAVSLIKQYDLVDSTGGPYHFMISDKTGESVIIEYYENEMHVIEDEKCMTNHDLSGLVEEKSSFLRTYERRIVMMNELIAKEGILSENEALDLLQSVTLSWTDGDDTIGGTLYSVIYNMEDKTMKLVYREKEKVYEFKIA